MACFHYSLGDCLSYSSLIRKACNFLSMNQSSCTINPFHSHSHFSAAVVEALFSPFEILKYDSVFRHERQTFQCVSPPPRLLRVFLWHWCLQPHKVHFNTVSNTNDAQHLYFPTLEAASDCCSNVRFKPNISTFLIMSQTFHLVTLPQTNFPSLPHLHGGHKQAHSSVWQSPDGSSTDRFCFRWHVSLIFVCTRKLCNWIKF